MAEQTNRPDLIEKGAGIGALFMLGGSLSVTLNDALVKLVGGRLPVGEIMTLRGVMLIGLILAYVMIARPPGGLKVHNKGKVALRAVFMVAATFTFIGGLLLMPIGEATALVFVSPLLATIGAYFYLKEKVGWRRWSAVVIGLIGVIIMLRPGQALNWAVLLPLATAFFVAAMDIMTRALSKTESSIAILFFTTLAVVIGGLVTLPLGWVMPSAQDWAILAGAAILVGASQYFQIEAVRHAEVSALMPLKYTSLVWAMLLGFFVWDDVPDLFVVVGSLMICGAGLFVWLRERIRGSQLRHRLRHQP